MPQTHRPSRCHPHTQPLAGAAFPQTQPPQTQTQPLVLQAPPQLLVGDGSGDDDDNDENDHEDLDTRAVLGEESFEEEEAPVGDLGDDDDDEKDHEDLDERAGDSEAEERALKRKVKAFARAAPTPNRFGFASASNHRCRPAVGGGAARSDSVHNCAIQHGVELTLTSLCAKDGKGRKFVAAQNHHALTCSHDLRRDWSDIVSSQGGWCFAQNHHALTCSHDVGHL